MDKMSAEYQRAVDEFVQREVIYCVSGLIYDLSQNEQFQQDLYDENLLAQDDWQTPAEEAGWRELYGKIVKTEEDDHDVILATADSWQDACDQDNLDPYQTEAYEHWIVTNWFARKLEEKGEIVCRDFHGLTIWGRTTTGQAISMDYVIQQIYDELHAEGAL
jgi:hypothetical protein